MSVLEKGVVCATARVYVPASEVELLCNQRVQAEASKRGITASWSVPVEVVDRGGIGQVVAGIRHVDEILIVFLEIAPTLQERHVEHPHFRVDSDSVFISRHSLRHRRRVLIAVETNRRNRRATVSIKRVPKIESDALVLRKYRQVEIALAILCVRSMLSEREIREGIEVVKPAIVRVEPV